MVGSNEEKLDMLGFILTNKHGIWRFHQWSTNLDNITTLQNYYHKIIPLLNTSKKNKTWRKTKKPTEIHIHYIFELTLGPQWSLGLFQFYPALRGIMEFFMGVTLQRSHHLGLKNENHSSWPMSRSPTHGATPRVVSMARGFFGTSPASDGNSW